jgi:hypothetical protein
MPKSSNFDWYRLLGGGQEEVRGGQVAGEVRGWSQVALVRDFHPKSRQLIATADALAHARAAPSRKLTRRAFRAAAECGKPALFNLTAPPPAKYHITLGILGGIFYLWIDAIFPRGLRRPATSPFFFVLILWPVGALILGFI